MLMISSFVPPGGHALAPPVAAQWDSIEYYFFDCFFASDISVK